ncbi:hypothetical protein Pfo_016285 [Paulownia fortunei]|nr:hypothetical protein Pfo_016285 [Paulownia fortunei]
MANAVISMALETLRVLLVWEDKFLFSMNNQVEEVQRELNTMYYFLNDADKKKDGYNSKTVGIWMAELKDLACHAEDNLKKMVKIFTCIFSKYLSVHQVRKEIELGNIVKADSSTSFAGNNHQKWLRPTYAHQVEEHFVSLEEDIDCLISVDGGRANQVIRMGNGWSRAWVCLTQKFTIRTVLQQILKQLHPFKIEEKLIMIHCKVLLTTQNENVDAQEGIYKHGYVTEDQGWELLHKIVLSNNYHLHFYSNLAPYAEVTTTTKSKELEDIENDLINKYGHLPLASFVIEGILHEKQSVGEWKKRRAMQVLDLSYNVLPYHLKPYFLHLGFFLEDEEINAENLDVAERYLSELTSRYMVQVKVFEFPLIYRRFELCRLHDLMRDLCFDIGYKLIHLRYLGLRDCLLDELPSSISNFPCLETLELEYAGSDSTKLPNVRRHFWAAKWLVMPQDFLNSAICYFESMPHLEEWRVDDGAMPSLSTLAIFNCTKLEMIPNGLRFITSLQILQIVSMPKVFEDRLQIVDGEDG